MLEELEVSALLFKLTNAKNIIDMIPASKWLRKMRLVNDMTNIFLVYRVKEIDNVARVRLSQTFANTTLSDKPVSWGFFSPGDFLHPNSSGKRPTPPFQEIVTSTLSSTVVGNFTPLWRFLTSSVILYHHSFFQMRVYRK